MTHPTPDPGTLPSRYGNPPPPAPAPVPVPAPGPLPLESPPGPGPDPEATPAARHRLPRGAVIAILGALLALFLVTLPWLPDTPGNLTSLAQTVAPWFGLGILPLLVLALIRRSALAAVGVLLPLLTWSALFGTALGDRSRTGLPDLTVVSHNVDDANTGLKGTARTLLAADPQVIALQELTPRAVKTFTREFRDRFPHHVTDGSIGIWSSFPLRAVRPVPIMGWTRALHATLDTPRGPVSFYTAHLASVRVRPDAGFTTARRNDSADRLVTALRQDPAWDQGPVLLLGDFNGAGADRSLHLLFDGFHDAQAETGSGFGATWPATFPLVRIDHVLVRGATPLRAHTLPATGSDHLPIAAALKLPSPTRP